MDTSLTADVARIVGDIVDPELGSSLAELGMLKSVQVSNKTVTVKVALTTMGCPLKNQIANTIKDALSHLTGFEVKLEFEEMDKSEREAVMSRARAAIQARSTAPEHLVDTRVIAIASGKGGVGKSTISLELAKQFASRKLPVGLLDADVLGYSQANLLDIEQERLIASGSKESWKIEPVVVDDYLSVVSMGLMVESSSDAIMWRGPMLARAFQHFIEDVNWNNPDYLIIDLPPGTGDIALTLARLLPSSHVAVITTPSPLAVAVAERAVSFALKANLHLLGVIENLSWLECEHGGKMTPFGSGGGAMLAEKYQIPLLGKLPMLTDSSQFNESAKLLASEVLTRIELDAMNEATCTARLWQAVTST
jgi:ATP-binding protein involved in chromosome partitioning